ncbi:hypothetical protein Pan216_15160 [Planctomycetes bacterium Pan216]|uniref:Uncharacterized protein n=1 Tax=Kolteria novifilia TaxID=2527975 RepID=A0A518B112_9BACT|nr:hypothetical protein Pan216_15160 [Planctomycetes bacterium Pan216]
MDSIETYTDHVERMEKLKLSLSRMLKPRELAKVAAKLDESHAAIVNGLSKTELPEIPDAAMEKLQATEEGRDAIAQLDRLRQVVQLAKQGQLPAEVSKLKNEPWVKSKPWKLFGLRPRAGEMLEPDADDGVEFVEWAHSEWISSEDIERETIPATSPEDVQQPDWADGMLHANRSALGSISDRTEVPSASPETVSPSEGTNHGKDITSFSQWLGGKSVVGEVPKSKGATPEEGEEKSEKPEKPAEGGSQRTFLSQISSSLKRRSRR